MISLISPQYELVLSWIGESSAAGAALGCIYYVLASYLVIRFRMRRASVRRDDGDASPPMTVLKPLRGAEPRLLGRLSSFCIQKYDGPIQLVFGTHDCTDPAIEVVKRLQADFPEQSITLKIDPQEHGANRKISNLVNMMPLAKNEILIIADSDIEVGPHYYSSVVRELKRNGVGAVTCLYHGVAEAGLWSRLSALTINSYFLPQVILALSFRLAQPCFGSTIAIRRSTLTSVGGFQAFSDVLADDYAIGEAVRACGQAVVVPPMSVAHVCLDNDFRSMMQQQLRFARTIRSIDPLGYVGSIITHPFPLALIGASSGSTSCLYLAALALGCRVLACVSVERAFRLNWQHYWLIPIQDIISFGAYLGSYMGRTVVWREQRYRVLQDGGLVQE